MKNDKKGKGEEKPPTISPDSLARAIVEISEALRALTRSGLNRKAIITLVADDTKISKSTITHVLDSLEDLRSKYVRP